MDFNNYAIANQTLSISGTDGHLNEIKKITAVGRYDEDDCFYTSYHLDQIFQQLSSYYATTGDFSETNRILGQFASEPILNPIEAGVIHCRNQQYKEAFYKFHTAKMFFPNSGFLWTTLAQVYSKIGNESIECRIAAYSSALFCLEKGKECDWHKPALYAKLNCRLGNFRDIISMSLPEELPCKYTWKYLLALMHQDQLAAASQLCNKIIKTDFLARCSPKQASRTLIVVAIVYALLGQIETSKEFAQRANALMSEDRSLICHLNTIEALSAQLEDNPKSAREKIVKAIESPSAGALAYTVGALILGDHDLLRTANMRRFPQSNVVNMMLKAYPYFDMRQP